MADQRVTHEQIYSRLGHLEGLLESEGEARRNFRSDFKERLEAIEGKLGETTQAVWKLQRDSPQAGGGLAHAVIRLFERQPFLGLIAAVVLLGLGSGGVVTIWEAFTK